MKTTLRLTLVLAGFCIAGCSSEDNPTPQPSSVTSDQAWAGLIIEQSAQWDAVTTDPVMADPEAYVLCRSPIPSDEPKSPHNPKGNDNTASFDPDSDPGPIHTNQFAVNDKARPYFKLIPADSWPIDEPDAYPVGSIIVKEKYDNIKESEKRGRANAIAVMTKQSPGYDPEHGDWEYGYIEFAPDGQASKITRGKIASCIDCHSNRSASDYVFRDYLTTR